MILLLLMSDSLAASGGSQDPSDAKKSLFGKPKAFQVQKMCLQGLPT